MLGPSALRRATGCASLLLLRILTVWIRIDSMPVSLLEDLDALQEAVNRAAMDIRNPEAARIACEEIDRPREEKWRTLGNRNLAADLIRKSRDEA
jgi:hypothetical protein